MKKVFLIFGLLFMFAITGLAVHAKGNYLHTITLEHNQGGYNVILDTDKMADVSKKIKSANELIIEISGVTSSDTVNALYKGTDNIDNLVIENNEPNRLKIYITAQDIKDSSVIIKPSGGEGKLVAETFPKDKVIWFGFVLLLFAVIFKTAKSIVEEDSKILIKKDIKDREIEMYKNYRKDLENSFGVNPYSDLQMKSMLRKIDRKIDERLSTSLK